MLAKIATTVDIVSGGRLVFGIGAGSRPSHPLARREYEAHGLPYHDFRHSVEDLAEACTVIRRLWTATEPFDFHGAHVDLTGAFGNPKPVRHRGGGRWSAPGAAAEDRAESSSRTCRPRGGRAVTCHEPEAGSSLPGDAAAARNGSNGRRRGGDSPARGCLPHPSQGDVGARR